MRVKRFVGDSVTDVMKRIKKELGPEAVILQTRHYKEGGILGVFGQHKIEITAALDDTPPPDQSHTRTPAQQGQPFVSQTKNADSEGSDPRNPVITKSTPSKTGAKLSNSKDRQRPSKTQPSRADKLYESYAGSGAGRTLTPNLTHSQQNHGDDAGIDKLLRTIAQVRAQGVMEKAAIRVLKDQDGAADGHRGAGQRGAGKTDVGQTVAGHTGASHTGAGQRGVGQENAGHTGGQRGVGQTVAGQPGVGQTDDGHRDAGQPDVGHTVAGYADLKQADMEHVNFSRANDKHVNHELLSTVNMSNFEVSIMSMLNEIHQYLNEESGGAGFVPEVLHKWRDYLSGRGISAQMCRELLFRIQINLKRELWHDDRHVMALLHQDILAKCGRTQILDVKALKKKTRPLVMALVGPTGVGKTTTIGKLAAGFSIVESHKVALIAADTYRVAAVEQLRTFGEILGIPVDVVMNTAGMQDSLARHMDKDVIIIDTAGRSPNHVMHMDELEEFMVAARPDLTLLVISATTGPREQGLVLERFRPLSTHLVLTKLDESRSEGVMLDLVCRTDLPLTYLTNGQNVPDDIEIATPEKLARWILGKGVVRDVS